MSWTHVGTDTGANQAAAAHNNQQVGNLLIVQVINFVNSTNWVTGLSGGGATWVQAGVKFSGTNNAFAVSTFLGTVTATGSATPTLTWQTGGAPSGSWGYTAVEFHSSIGSWSFDKQGNLDTTASNSNWPSLTPANSGSLYCGYVSDATTAQQGSTSGYVYAVNLDTTQDGNAYNLNCAAGVATFPVWVDTGQQFGMAILVAEGAGGTAPAAEEPRQILTLRGRPRVRYQRRQLQRDEPIPVQYSTPNGTTVWGGSNTSGYSGPLTVVPTQVGDLMVATVANQGGTSVASLSGGGVTNWYRLGAPWTDSETTPTILEVWYGTVTTAGSTTVSITWNAAPGAHFCELNVQQFHCSVSGGYWVGELNTNKTNASASTVNWPQPAPPTIPPCIYVGYASTPSTISWSNPQPAAQGFATENGTPGNNSYIWGTRYTGTVAPTLSVSISSTSYCIAALFYYQLAPVYPIATGRVTGTPSSRVFPVNLASCPDGSTILAWVSVNNNTTTASTLTDSAGNTYVLDQSWTSTSPMAYYYRCDGATGGPGGGRSVGLDGTDTFTLTTLATSANMALYAVAVPSGPGLDSSAITNGTNVTAITQSITPTANNEIIVQGLVFQQAGLPEQWSGGNWNTLPNQMYGADPVSGGAYVTGAGVGTTQTASETMAQANYRSVLWALGAAAPTPIALADRAAAVEAVRQPMSNLTDNFPGSAVDTTKWGSYGTATVASNTLTLTDVANSTAYSGIQSNLQYDLTGTNLIAHLTNGGSQFASTQGMIECSIDANNSLALILNNGNLIAQTDVAGTFTTRGTIAWVGATMSWLRIRESGGTTFWDYSADGITWTNLASLANPFAVTSLYAIIQQGAYTTSDPSTTTTWQSVNLPPTGATPALADVGAGVEASSAMATVPLADVGAGVESSVAAATVPLADVGAGTEAVSVSATVPLPEVAAGVEALAVTVTVPLAEVAGAAEASPRELIEAAGAADVVAATVSVPLAETGAGVESLAVTATTAAADAAAGTEQLSASVAVPLADTGAGADTSAATVTLPLADVAGATEAMLSGMPVSFAEAGAGADAITVPTETIPLADAAGATEAIPVAETSGLPEAAGAAEALAVSAVVPLSESGAASDALAASATVPLAEVAAGAEASVVAATLPLADVAGAAEYTPRELPEAAGASDALTVAVTLPLADAAGAADVLSWTGAVTLPETGAASEALAVAAAVGLAETGAAGEALTATASVPLAEVAGAYETSSIGGSSNPSLPEVGGGAEQLSVAATLPPAGDVAGAADTLAVAATAAVAFGEAGAALESAAAVVVTPAADTAAAAESATVSAALPLADQSGASEALGASVSLPAAETAASVDQLSAAVQARAGDAAGASEAFGVSKPVPLPEIAAAADSFSVHIQLSFGPEPIWDAEPVDSQWMAHADAPAWAVEQADPVWTAGGQAGQWAASVALAWWRIVMAVFEPIAAVSLEHVNARWTSDLDGSVTDPTAGPMTVQFAFPASSGDENHPAAPVTWYPGVWVPPNGTAKGFLAQCLVGPSGGVVALTAGHSYDVWSKIITNGAEQPAKFVGVQAVY